MIELSHFYWKTGDRFAEGQVPKVSKMHDPRYINIIAAFQTKNAETFQFYEKITWWLIQGR